MLLCMGLSPWRGFPKSAKKTEFQPDKFGCIAGLSCILQKGPLEFCF